MKKKYLLTLFLLTFSLGTASAQSSYVGAYNIHSTAKHTIIRDVSYPSYISCANSGRDSVTFTYTDQNNECYEKVFNGYWINDFIVFQDTLFFCGRTADSVRANRGIVGFFKFDHCFQNIDSIYIYSDFRAGEAGHEVRELKKIGYIRTLENVPHIVCIGTCSINKYPCLIDICKSFFNPTMWEYNGGSINDAKEGFSDLAFVTPYLDYRTYLVTAGLDKNQGNYISLRIYNPNYLLDPTGIENRQFYFCNDFYDNKEWVGDDILISNVWDGVFSTVSYRYGLISDKSRDTIFPAAKRLHIAFYKIGNFLALNNTGMIQDYYVNLSNYVTHKLNHYIRKANGQTLEFMHTMYPGMPSAQSHFCDIEYSSLSTSGTLSAFYHTDFYMQGLSTYGNNKYIMSGIRKANKQWVAFGKETFANSSNCANSIEYNYHEGKPPFANLVDKPFTSTLEVIRWDTVAFSRSQTHITDVCPR